MRRPLGGTSLRIAPLVLGGNVFGWTADRETSFAILDAFLDAGFNAIDTADVYNRFAPGLSGGESETIIGDWMADRQVRDEVVLITKGGLDMGTGEAGLGRAYLPRALDASLRRLRTDRVDIYVTHLADPETPVGETLDTLATLRDAGKLLHAGCSNYTLPQLREALEAGVRSPLAYEVFQPRYNLHDREFEGATEDLCVRHGLGVIVYYALAAGFLTGKHRDRQAIAGSARERVLTSYMTERGLALLRRLDEVAARHGSTPARVALAWIMARPSVAAPIASVTSVAQLHDILRATQLRLGPEDLALLDQDDE